MTKHPTRKARTKKSKTQPPKAKRASQGERIVLRRLIKTLPNLNPTLEGLRTRAIFEHCRAEAKEHDTAIRRAIRRAVRDHKQTLASLKKVKYAVDCGAESIAVELAIRDRFEAKYGVRL